MFKWFGIVNFTPSTRVAAFADELREGRLMASRCKACGQRSFPPRADCARCLSPEFEWVEIGGGARLVSWSRVSAPPSGFEAYAPYTIGVVDLDEGGRALAWIGESLAGETLRVGLPLRLVPRLHEETEEIHVDYTLEAVTTAAREQRPPAAAAGSPTPDRRSGR